MQLPERPALVNTSSSHYGTGVVGLGVGEQHAMAYEADPRCRLRWLHDFSTERAAAVCDRVGGGQVASSYTEILEDPETQIVSIATFDDHHFDDVSRALDAGKNVFVEKPLCRTGKELRALHAAWISAGKPKMASNLVLREAPVYRWLAETATAGRLGRIYAFDGDYLYGRLHKITDGWRKDVDDYSVMSGGGIHLIDLMLTITGERPTTVTATGSNVATADSDFRYDDFMAATFAFPSGLVGRITANFGCVHPHRHIVRAFGTKATFLCDDQGPRLMESRADDADARPLDMPVVPASKGILIPEFIASLDSGDDQATCKEFDVISVCIAADEAHRTGSTTQIEYLT